MEFTSAFKELMQCSEIITVCSAIHSKYTNTFCGEDSRFFE
jgi:hypothetical protein